MMNIKPDVTVVIPLYNKEKYIERAVCSVLNQTYPNFEVIIVDDGSTDQSLKVLEKITDNRIIIVSQINSGASAARNHGIRKAKAELIAFLDADDEWLPDMIETLLRLRRNYPEAGAYATSYEIIEDGIARTRDIRGIPEPPWEGIIPDYFYALFNSPNEPNHTSSTAVLRHVFDEVGFFPEDQKQGEDMDMFFRIALEYPFAMSTKTCSRYYRDTENSLSRAWHESCAYPETIRQAVNKGKIPEYLREEALEFAALQDIYSAGEHYRQGERDLARKMLRNITTKRYHRKKRHLWMMTYDNILLIKWGLILFQYTWDWLKKKRIVSGTVAGD